MRASGLLLGRSHRIASLVATTFACTLLTAPSVWADDNPPADGERAPLPAYTLDVESDEPSAVSFELLAPRIGADLGSPVVRSAAGAPPPARAAITVRLRARELTVRAVHSGGRVLERTVKAEGDDEAIQREAVLLAGNLARDEAREILDALATRAPAPVEAARPPAPTPPPPAPRRDPEAPATDGEVVASAAIVYPLATNAGRPHVGTWADLSLLYSHVGAVRAFQGGSGVVHASRGATGAQLAAGAAITQGSLAGVQASTVVNITTEDVRGVQLTSGGNIAGGGVTGVRLSGAFNVTRGAMKGVDLSGGANVATHEVAGAQIAPVNVAESVDGMQLGVVNIGRRVRGTQLGIVNIADEVDGAALGIISISRHGVHPIAWASNLHYTNVGVKFATKYVYTITALQYGTLEGGFGTSGVGSTVALGGHIPVPLLGPDSFDVEVEAAYSNITPDPGKDDRATNQWIAGHGIVGYSFFRHLRVFAGGGVRAPISVDMGREVVRPEVQGGVQF